MNKKGFSLVEIILVLALITMISVIAVPKFVEIQRFSSAKSDIRTAEQIGKAVRMWLEAADETTSKQRINELKEIKEYGTLTGIDEYIPIGYLPNALVDSKFYPDLNNEGKVIVKIAGDSSKNTTDTYLSTNPGVAGIAYTEK